MTALYIFDLDGTLSDAKHREPILSNRDDPDKWRKFYAASKDDPPIESVVKTLNLLYTGGAEILIFTGRSEEVRDTTVKWLAEHTLLMTWQLKKCLRMREVGDFTADYDLKSTWHDELLPGDKSNLVGVFEDRTSVVQMWRAKGVMCFQVAEGDF